MRLLLSRLNFVGAAMAGGLAGFQLSIGGPNPFDSSRDADEEKKLPAKVATYHDPPPGVDYDDNPSVFGRILRGELASADYAETPTLLAFRDRTPRASLHALVIPKAYVWCHGPLPSHHRPVHSHLSSLSIPIGTSGTSTPSVPGTSISSRR